jgi:hypothetical protein
LSKNRELIRKWGSRYIKYNVIGIAVFLLNIIIYVIIFPFLGEWSYVVVSMNGGIMEFTLIAYINKTKKGVIFDSCTPSMANEQKLPR